MARKMKDSGIEWIGEIPEGWSIARGKHILTLLQRAVFPTDGIITCFRDGEVTLRSNRREDGFTVSLKEIGYQGIEPGDLVVHGMDGFAGSIGISDSRGKSSPVLVVLDSSQDKKYLMYYLRSMAYNNVFLALSTGIRVRSCDLKWNKLADLLYLVPPIVEQHKLVSFLDEKCSEIDAMLSKTRASIEEYKKLKQAVITQAVTKGVRGEREMKDSGVAWIGEIPADWTIQRFARVAEVKSNLVSPDNYLEYPQISPENIEKDSGKLLLPCKTVAEVGVISGNHLFYKGQILYSKIRPKLNKVCIAPFDGLCSADMYPIETNNDTRYIMYCILSNGFLQQVSMITENRVKMPKINQVELSKILVAMPCFLAEQKEIADYLDAKCAEIDGLIAKKEQLAKELESYKKSLIYEVVTGKREV